MKKIISGWRNFYSSNLLYLSIFVFFCALFALTNSGVDSSEGVYHYQVAEQIIKHGQLGFDTPQEGIFQVAPNGRSYAGHEIGNTIFLLPTALINVILENILSQYISQETIERIQQFILSFQAGIYVSLTATVFFAILTIGFSQAIIPSFIATLCLTLTTYLWTYSRNLFDGVLCTTLFTSAFFLILRYRQTNNLKFLCGCFLCLGLAFITRVTMILAIIITFGYLFSIYRSSLKTRFREISLAIFTLLPFFIWQSWYNYLRTGIFYKSPVQTAVYAENNALDGNIFLGINGLLFSPGKSIFIYAPLLILSVILFKKFYIEHKKEAIYIAAITILWFLLHAKLRNWYGAAGWGSRHLLTIVPIAFLPFAVNLKFIWQKTALRIATILLASFGFILALSSIISNWHFRMIYAVQRGIATLEVNNNFIWNFWQSQPIDMIGGAYGNIVRILTHAPIITIKDTYSEANEYASSTINVWSNSFLHAGVPWYLVLLLVTPLLISMYVSARNILRSQVNN
ncbi:MAG: glycosyltransferase family 39 protein [Nostochopsis sp.]